MHLNGCMRDSGSESVSDKEENRNSESSVSGSSSESESGSSSSGSGSRRNSGSESRRISRESRRVSVSGSGTEKSGDEGYNKSGHNDRLSNNSVRQHNVDDKLSSEDHSNDNIITKGRNRKLSSDVWEENPDIYGIRRSGRSRREPERLKIVDSDSSDKPKTNHRSKRKKSDSWNSDASSESESDFDGSPPPPSKRPGAAHHRSALVIRKKKPTRRRNRYSSEGDGSSLSDEDSRNRATTRRTKVNTVSYKEQSDEQTDSSDLLEVDEGAAVEEVEEDRSETIERVLAQRRGKKGATGSITTIYHIEENGDPNDGCDPSDEESTEQQYFIKWKGWAHIHNTWETEESLVEQKVKGMKKLENFKKKEADLSWWRSKAGPEDIDYYECQQELQQDLVQTYNSVERLIAEQTRETETGTAHEYLCKWESLPYADATWEDAALIERRWPEKVAGFRNREDSRTTPSRHTPALRRRPAFRQLRTQPTYMGADKGMTLRDYQMDGLNWLIASWCKDNSVILADEMGLGKTIQTICFLYYLFKEQALHGPFLCVVPLSTMTAWQREFEIWAPDINVVTYLGDITSRDIIRQFEWSFSSSKRLKFNAILTTYEILIKDAAFLRSFSWAVLLVDEAHRLKNDESLLYRELKQFDTNQRLLVTGTPLQNSLKELWALLHFIMPYHFDSWADWEKEHENAATKGYQKLHKQLEPFILRRQKKDVEKSLPAKVEQILRVEMTAIQKQYYKWILTKNYSALRKGVKGSLTTFINIVVELKKCCNHASLTRPIEYEADATSRSNDAVQQILKGSGKLLLLDKLLVRLRETGHRVLIFSQMVRMLDIIAEYLQKRHFPFQRLDGSIKGDIRKQALDHFNAEGSQDFCFLLSTRAGGLGINLATADTVIIFDSDWNPQNDLQAQARAHRIGQKNQVNIYRLVTARSVEEDIVERAKRKMVLDHLVIQRMDTTGRTVLQGPRHQNTNNPFDKEDLNAILKFGAEELFKDDDNGEEEPQCDIDEILRRAETRDEPAALAGDELLSAFKVARIAFKEDPPQKSNKDWDDIIPEDVRKNIEEEERTKEMEDLYLPPRLRKTVNANNGEEEKRGKKRKGSSDDSESDQEEEEEAEEEIKRRGRPPRANAEALKGFNEREIRRFVKSYKKFSAPLHQLESIAADADLRDKPLSDLKKLASALHARCEHTLASAETEKSGTEGGASGAKSRARLSFKIGGVVVNAKTLAACERELGPLHELLPSTLEARLNWVLPFKTRSANFDSDWTVNEDSKLLVGIYQHGMGSWEAIKIDASLGLTDKVLPNSDSKPQAKHLQSRAEYLLKVVKKLLDQQNGKQKKTRKKRTKKLKEPVTKDIVEDAESSGEEGKEKEKPQKEVKVKEKVPKPPKEDKPVSNEEKPPGVIEENKKERKKKDKEKKKDKNNKLLKGPMHFTANNKPQSLEIIGNLPPDVFEKCKEKMRPVKKALKALDKTDKTLPEEEQTAKTIACLIAIGKQIDECLNEYSNQDKKVEWRSNLWYFVSQFTNFEAKKLYRIYKYHRDNSHNAEQPKEEINKTNNHKSSSVASAATPSHTEKVHNSENKKKEKERDGDRDNRREGSAESRDRKRDRDRDRGDRDRERTRDWDKKRKTDDDYENENKRHGGNRRRSRSRDRNTHRRGGNPYDVSGAPGWYGAPPSAPRPHSSSNADYHSRPYDKRHNRYGPMPAGASYSNSYGGYYDSPSVYPRDPRSGYDWRGAPGGDPYHPAPHHQGGPPQHHLYRQSRRQTHHDL